ncbi:hypothetical protein E1B28_007592 [Marasmius oreades]|uniref:Uncharacterized protein n=1 Tax=Marasmius oreades TaxID=181124 RepID=A0A9P7S294_9AGAR|nr:uncharacterized protein E1B28_007592 [Marasmius oreades]KAG7093960.1 hypothetical protein E1B28_007592 [Marasmius oreades]
MEGGNVEQDTQYTAEQKGKGREGFEEKGSGHSYDVGKNPPPPIPNKRGRPKKEPAIILPRQPTRPNANNKHEKNKYQIVEGSVGKPLRKKGNSKRKDTMRWFIEENKPIIHNSVTHNAEANEDCPSELRPRQWCSNRTELLLIHPELSGKSCVNGICWEGTPLPVILLEGRHGISISSPKSREGEGLNCGSSQTTMDVTIKRTFECAIKDLPGGTLPHSILHSYHTVALPQTDSVAPDEGVPSCSRVLEPVETSEPVQAQNESGQKVERIVETGINFVTAETLIKHEILDIPLSLVDGPPCLEETLGNRVKNSQKSSCKSKRLKVTDSGDGTARKDSKPHSGRALNSQNMEPGEQPRLAHEHHVSSSGVEDREQGRITIPQPIGPETFVSNGACSQTSPSPSNSLSELTISTQCNSKLRGLSPLSPLTPSPVFEHGDICGTLTLRRSRRISEHKISHDTIPRTGKRKREITPASSKPRKKKKRSDRGKVIHLPYIKEEDVAASSPVKSHAMTVRQSKGKEEYVNSSRGSSRKAGVTKLAGPPKNFAKLISPSQDERDFQTPKVTPSQPAPSLPFTVSKPKYAGMKFKKTKAPAAVPAADMKESSATPTVEQSPDFHTSTFHDTAKTCPTTVQTINIDPGEFRSNPNVIVGHPFPLQNSPFNEPAPLVIPPISTQTISNPYHFAVLSNENKVSAVIPSIHSIEAPSNDKAGHLLELLQANEGSQQDIGSLSLAPTFPPIESADCVERAPLKDTSYQSLDNRLEPTISPTLLTIPSPIPSPIPSEIQAVIDLQTNNALILGIASREVFNDKAGTRLADEYGYLYTGLWRVIDTKTASLSQEMLTRSGYVGPDGKFRGRVQWTFTLQWVPGKEEGWDPRITLYPWWHHFRNVESPLSTTDTVSSYASLICPTLLICNIKDDGRRQDKWSAGDGDAGSTRGWYCSDCGKFNRQTYWRRRKCGSTLCRDKLVTACSVKSLDHVRERGQQQPIVLPMNTHPRYIDPLIIEWKDGLMTLVYETGLEHSIRHVFTCNVGLLQEEQTSLFEKIQEHLLLRRKPEDSRPYFSYAIAEVPSTFTLANEFSATVETWDQAHPCITQTRGLLSHTARHYGELKHVLEIKSLLLLTWTVGGRRKAKIPLQAKEQGIILMTLGHETLISLSPKSGLRRVEVNSGTSNTTEDLHAPPSGSGFACTQPTEDLAPIIIKPEPLEQPMDIDAPGLLSFPPEELGGIDRKDFELIPINCTGCPAERPKNVDQRKDSVLKFTLVHGDALILFGDDFEYTIERDGVSILLIGVLG